MKKQFLVVGFLAFGWSVNAQNVIFRQPSTVLLDTKVILPAYFTPVAQWKIQELAAKPITILPKIHPKFQLEISETDTHLLSQSHLQSLFYRMKNWYAFQHKNKNGFRQEKNLLPFDVLFARTNIQIVSNCS